jgi:DnaK suppressor protein
MRSAFDVIFPDERNGIPLFTMVRHHGMGASDREAPVSSKKISMDESTARRVLGEERKATLARIQAMTVEFEGIVGASAGSSTDDEHDPEGSTLAFERAQVTALLNEARSYLRDLDHALAKLAVGAYAVCERCGAQIASERLAARPAARTCIRCAASPRPD